MPGPSRTAPDASQLASLDAQASEILEALRIALAERAPDNANFVPRGAPMSRVEVLACLERARCAVSDFQREAKRASQRAAQEQRNALQWERNAMLAVKAGDDALAREVLARKAEHDRLATCHAQHADVLARQLARLSEMLALADSAALNS